MRDINLSAPSDRGASTDAAGLRACGRQTGARVCLQRGATTGGGFERGGLSRQLICSLRRRYQKQVDCARGVDAGRSTRRRVVAIHGRSCFRAEGPLLRRVGPRVVSRAASILRVGPEVWFARVVGRRSSVVVCWGSPREGHGHECRSGFRCNSVRTTDYLSLSVESLVSTCDPAPHDADHESQLRHVRQSAATPLSSDSYGWSRFHPRAATPAPERTHPIGGRAWVAIQNRVARH
jgi:hypothetical protein